MHLGRWHKYEDVPRSKMTRCGHFVGYEHITHDLERVECLNCLRMKDRLL